MRLIKHLLAVIFVGAVTFTMALPSSTAWAADPVFPVPVGERQLFLDDVGIAKIGNLKRTMHQPNKKGAVIRPNWLAGENSLQIRSGPFWDPNDKIFKFWLHTDHLCRTSVDGLHWTISPELGSRAPSEVFFDPTDPDPARRYKSFSPSQLAVSPDGKTWNLLEGVTIPSQDEFNFSLDQQERLYIATVKHGGPHGRAVHLSTSRDFEHWTAPELIFHADKLDQQLGRQNIKARLADKPYQEMFHNDPAFYNVDVYNMGVFRYEGLYIGVPAMYHAVGPVPNYPNTDGFHMLQLACSRDLKTWKRLGDRKAFIPYSRIDSGAYDLTQMIGPSHALLRGPDCPGDKGGVMRDELWLYYTALKFRAGYEYVGTFPNGKHVKFPNLDKDHGAICLAVLRRDGFISLDAGDTEGTVRTAPFNLPSTQLFVNVDAPNGELRVELLNGKGKAVAKSEPLTGDMPREPVKWAEGNMTDLKDQTASLRFTLRNGQFYSYWLE